MQLALGNWQLMLIPSKTFAFFASFAVKSFVVRRLWVVFRRALPVATMYGTLAAPSGKGAA